MRRAIIIVAVTLLTAVPVFAVSSVSSSINAAPPCADAGTPARETVTLSVSVVDAVTRTPLRARVSVVDCHGDACCPACPDSCFFHDASWAHRGYFYSDGACTLEIDPGCTLLGIGAGFEYAPVSDTLAISGSTALEYEMVRVVDAGALGLWSGDAHSHMCHPGGVYTIGECSMVCLGEAEGLSVVNVLDNTHGFSAGVSTASSEDCLVYITEEQRSSVLGHTGFLGLTELIEPFNSDWAPLISDAAALVHAQPGAAVVCAHPVSIDDFFDLDSGPAATMLARELPVGLVNGAYDAFEALSYSNCHHQGRELALWYQILNCGFPVPACGGTDACVNRLTDRPLGGYRTYASCDDDLDFDEWLSSVVAGRSFITNGPLFTEFEVDDAGAGETLTISGGSPAEFDVQLAMISAFPVRRADIVVNGEIAESICLAAGTTEVDETVTVTVSESSWIAARVFGETDDWFVMGDSLFAHTNPVYIEMDGERIVKTADADAFVSWLDDLEQLGETRGEWEAAADSVRFFDAVAYARVFFEALAEGISTDAANVHGGATPPLLVMSPSPCRRGTTIALSNASSSMSSLTVYAPHGRVVRRIGQSCVAGTREIFWDGTDDHGRSVASGVYLCAARLEDGTSARGKAVVLR